MFRTCLEHFGCVVGGPQAPPLYAPGVVLGILALGGLTPGVSPGFRPQCNLAEIQHMRSRLVASSRPTFSRKFVAIAPPRRQRALPIRCPAKFASNFAEHPAASVLRISPDVCREESHNAIR